MPSDLTDASWLRNFAAGLRYGESRMNEDEHWKRGDEGVWQGDCHHCKQWTLIANVVDPFIAEMWGDTELVWLCRPCYRALLTEK